MTNTTHIPDEAVQAANLAYCRTMDATDDFNASIRSAITAALPFLSAPCAVEVKNYEEEKRIDALRIQAFKTNSETDRKAYFDAASKWFQDRHLRRMEAKPVDVAAVREECAEVVENAVLSYHVADCAGLADWKAFEKGQESGLKFGAAAIRAFFPNEPVGRAALAQGGVNDD